MATVLTEDGEEYLVDLVVASADAKYHDSGTGTTGADKADAALETACGEARDTGTAEEGATTQTYKSIATHTYAGGFAITEAGLFDASTSGTLIIYSVFSAINVVASDKIEFTFTLEMT